MPEPKEMGSGVDVTKSERKVWLLKVTSSQGALRSWSSP